MAGFGPVAALPVASLPSAAAGGYTPPTGTLTLTGFAPTVTQDATVAPATGTLILTGYAPSLTQSTTLSPPTGALTLTGFYPRLAQTFFPPAFNWDVAWSYDIYGDQVRFCAYDPLLLQLLVIWTDGHYTLVTGVPMFTSASATQANCIAMVAASGQR